MRTIGKPKRSWMEANKKDILMLHVVEYMALNKDEWKKRIHVVDPKKMMKALLLPFPKKQCLCNVETKIILDLDLSSIESESI